MQGPSSALSGVLDVAKAVHRRYVPDAVNAHQSPAAAAAVAM
jgi:hypothetical protein